MALVYTGFDPWVSGRNTNGNPGLYKYEGFSFHYRTMELAISAFRAALIALELRRENND